jgi:hypothetical protein
MISKSSFFQAGLFYQAFLYYRLGLSAVYDSASLGEYRTRDSPWLRVHSFIPATVDHN